MNNKLKNDTKNIVSKNISFTEKYKEKKLKFFFDFKK